VWIIQSRVPRQLLDQATILGAKLPHEAVLFEPVLDEIPRRVGVAQKAHCNLSWCGNHSGGILPAIQFGVIFLNV
jgi:hypothetical protein